MRIAEHHKWKDADYVPRHAWPDSTFVQWGSNGVVLGANCYQTAFFEAFPAKEEDAGGFIRGEGKSIAAAEDDAFEKFTRQSICNHLWGREKYTNGGQLCRHCRAFRAGHVPPIVQLGSWRKPVAWYETWLFEGEDRQPTRYARKMQLRASVFGITERPKPVEQTETT